MLPSNSLDCRFLDYPGTSEDPQCFMKYRSSILLSLCYAAAFSSPLLVEGETYEIQKVSISGDSVPGLSEEFRFFRAVHMFDDSSVAFAGITTRGQSFLRDQSRGIYYASVPGSLSVIAEFDDADAFRSIGVPHNLLDSNSDKLFAFDYMASLESGLQNVIANKPFEGDLISLTPTDDSNANLLPLDPANVGRFEVDVSGLAVNEAGQTVFSSTFIFADDQVDPTKGIYQAHPDTGVRKIIFAGDDVPGIADATFFGFHSINQSEDGATFFSAQMAGAGAPSGTNDSLWMEDDGEFTMILREGSPAPGIPDYIINLTGGLNMLYLDVKNDRTIVFSGVVELGSQTTRAYWIGTPSGATLDPFMQVDSTPNLNDPDIFTVTDQGNIAFTSVDNNSIQLDSIGDIYFEAIGRRADDSVVNGLWKRSIIDGSITQLVAFDSANGLTDFELLDVSDQGDMLFLAESQNVQGIWVRDSGGELTNVVSVGDMLEGREVTGFANLGTTSGTFGQANKTLGDNRFHDLFSSSGDFVFVAQFEDSETDADTRTDEGIFTAMTAPDPTDKYRWTGEAGDDDWHKATNWDDEETNTVATQAPGNLEGTETIGVADATITISQPVHIANIDSGGRLIVNESLIVEEESDIEGLVLNSDLTIKQDLFLGGDTELKNGQVTGPGALNLIAGSLVEFSSLEDGGKDLHDVSVSTNLFGSANLPEGVSLDIQENGFLTVKEGGSLNVHSGKIGAPTNNILWGMNNNGTIRMAGENGGAPFTLEPFMNSDGGIFEIVSGELILKSEGTHENSKYLVSSGARLVFENLDEPAFNNIGARASGEVVGSGDGTIEFKGNLYTVQDGSVARFNMSIALGGMEITEDAVIEGDGVLKNEGRMVFKDAEIASVFENEGTVLITNDIPSPNLIVTNSINSFTNKQLVLQEGVVELKAPSGDDEDFIIANEGTWTMQALSLITNPEETSIFGNASSGTLRKEGTLPALMDARFVNEGTVQVLEGDLTFSENSFWRTRAIGVDALSISPGARLILSNSETAGFETHTIEADLEIRGGGTFLFEGEVLDFEDDDVTLTNVGSKIEIASTAFTMSKGEIHNNEGELAFVTNDTLSSVNLESNLRNGTKGTVTLPSDYTISMTAANTRILNEGEFNIGELSNELPPLTGLITTNNGLGTQFINSGYLTVSTRSSAEDRKDIIEPQFHASDEGVFGTVEVTNRTHLFFMDPSPETVRTIEGARAALEEGEWVVDSQSDIDFQSGIASTDFYFTELGLSANVTLKGDPLNFNLVGRIGGMPLFSEDFSNKGRLRVENGIVRMVANTFFNRGTLQLAPGRFEMVASDGNDGLFRNEGDVFGTGSFVGGNVINKGYMAPGFSAGSFTIEQDLIQEEGGVLALELGGTVPGDDYDQIVVEGTATLAGELLIQCIDDNMPTDGAEFSPLVAASIVGAFDTINYDIPSSRLKIDVAVGASGVTAMADVLDVATFDAWRTAVFDEDQLADVLISGPQADPDGDGYRNLLEYAFDGNPLRTSGSSLYSTRLEKDESDSVTAATIEFSWANGMTDLEYELEWSSDLVTWAPLESQELDAVEQAFTTRITLGASLANLDAEFIRLRVFEQ